MIQTFELSPGVTLRCFPDTRFKQSCLTVQFLRPLCREEAALNALLPAVLLRGCEGAPDMRRITLKLDDLYGAAVGALVRKVGDYQTTGLSCSFMEDRFTLDGGSVLVPMVAFLRQLLLCPVLENGVFSTAFVESERRNLILTIESQMNDKRTYASWQLTQKLCAGDPTAIPRLGDREQVAAITPASLYGHYQKVLRESPVQIFYVGSVDSERVVSLLKPLFTGLDRNPIALSAQTGFRGGDTGSFSETMEVAQGKLCMGFVSPTTLRDPGFAAMQVFNTLFGGGMISKLFMQVREKMSLCYDIGSGYHGTKGIITVSAGIDCKDEALVKDQVMAQLRACQEGQISPEELSAAKEALLSSLRGTHDSPGSIEGYYATAALSGLGLTPAEYMQAVSAVTAEDAAAAARSVTLRAAYFLKGAQV